MQFLTRFTFLFFLLAAPAFAAEPLFETLDLFTSNTGGYATYRIPGLVVTSKGTLLAYCEARKNNKSDWGNIDIFLRRSADSGKTWSEPRRLVTPPKNLGKNPVAIAQKLGVEGEVTLNNPVAIADRAGLIHFLYCAEYARCFYMRSDDDGLTFSEPVEITAAFEPLRKEYDWKVLATGPGHGIQLQTGRLLVPVWLSLGTGGHAHRPSCVSTLYSDDSGKTWKTGAIVVNHPQLKNPSETAAVELSDGAVMLNIRHESRPSGRAVSTSPNGISNWSKFHFDNQLPEPVCMASILRLPDSQRSRILFSNPHNPENTQRKNLAVKLSYDDAKTWPVMKVLDPNSSAYSDLAASADGTLFCLYERGGYKTLTLARFNLEWLTAGKDSFTPSRR
jgi:sialidase-1